MADERVVLQGVEAQLLEVAFLERDRTITAANATFARQVQPIRISHGITDGIAVRFALEDGEAVMRMSG